MDADDHDGRMAGPPRAAELLSAVGGVAVNFVAVKTLNGDLLLVYENVRSGDNRSQIDLAMYSGAS